MQKEEELIRIKEEKLMEDRKKTSKGALKTLCIVSFLCLIFMGIEVAGGLISGSLAILTDAAHLLSDFSGFAISMFAIWIGTRPANASMSYGYHRAEVIGAMGSILLIWGLTIWLLYEAVERVMHGHDVDG